MSDLGLLKYRKNVFSQCGEDGILEEIFWKIGTENKWCCEFGAWDGIRLSNTYNLIYNHNWSSIQIESECDRYAQLKSNMMIFQDVHCLHVTVEPQGAKALDNLLNQTLIPVNFDLLSIDIDGPDYWVWKFTERYRPRVVVIEVTNYCLDAQEIYKQGQPVGGSSILPMVELAKQKGYELACVPGNAIFILREFCDVLEIDPIRWRELVIKEVNSPEWRDSAPRSSI